MAVLCAYSLKGFANAFADCIFLSILIANRQTLLDRFGCLCDVLLLKGQHRLQK